MMANSVYQHDISKGETQKRKRLTNRPGSTSGDTAFMEKMAHLLY